MGVGACSSHTSKETTELLRSASRLSVLASTGGEEHRNFFTSRELVWTLHSGHQQGSDLSFSLCFLEALFLVLRVLSCSLGFSETERFLLEDVKGSLVVPELFCDVETSPFRVKDPLSLVELDC